WQAAQYWFSRSCWALSSPCASAPEARVTDPASRLVWRPRRKRERRKLRCIMNGLSLLGNALLRHQLLEQGDGLRFLLGAHGGQEHALGPAQRVTAHGVLHVQTRALAGQEADDVVGAAVGGAEQGRQAH